MSHPRSPVVTALLAFVASFSVYLLPILLPHVILPWGAMLAMETSLFGGRSPEWIATDFTFAVSIQLVACMFFFFWFRFAWWIRLLLLAVAIPLTWGVVEYQYVYEIPKRHLVEPEKSTEQATWPTECVAMGVSPVSVLKLPVTLSSEARSEAWVTRGMSYALLRMPGCRVEDLDPGLTGANYAGEDAYIETALPEGAVLFRKGDRTTGETTLWLVPAIGQAPVRIEAPPTHNKNNGSPILSTDGKWIAWGIRETLPDGRSGNGVLFRRLSDNHEEKLPFERFAEKGIRELLELQGDASELVVESYDGEYMGIGRDGSVHWKARVENAESQGFRRIGTGWIAWGNDYIGNGPSSVSWSLAGGTGAHRVPRGRRIDSAAAAPNGAFVALSVSAATNLGGAEESVYVVRTSDGSEVFRKFLPNSSRSNVGFVGRRYFAYSDEEGTHVLRVPD